MLKYFWPMANILKNSAQVSRNNLQVAIQSSVFNLPFQIVIDHPILNNNRNNFFPPV